MNLAMRDGVVLISFNQPSYHLENSCNHRLPWDVTQAEFRRIALFACPPPELHTGPDGKKIIDVAAHHN